MVLTGVVTSQDGIPIPYAKLKVNNNQKTVVSNSIGEFVIKKLYPMNANLLVKASGYAPQEIDLSNVDLSRTLRKSPAGHCGFT